MSISDVAVLVERSLQQVNDCIWPSGYYDPYLWIAIVGGLAMCWMGFGIGANDVANQFGSSVGSGAIVLWAAVVLALIFEFLGAVLLGGTVADAVRSGILDLDSLSDAPAVVMYANMCALIGAALWLQLASRYGLPVSTTHSIVGALIGVGVAAGQPGAVKWKKVGGIVLSWIASPLLSACLSSLIFVITRTGILRRRDPVKVGLRLLWLLVFVVTIVFTLFFVFKNSWVIGGMTCVKPDGSIEDPCSVQKWAEYNIGLAVVTSFGVAALLTLIFSPVAYWYSFRVLKKYDADGGMKFNQSQIGATETGGCSPVDVENGTGVQMQSNEAPNGTDTPTSDSQKARSLASVETAALDPRLGSPQWFKSKWDSAPWFRDLHGEAIAEDPFARELKQKTEKFDPRVERFFCTCQIISASFGCVAHGANDVANAVAPFATVLGIYHTCYVNEDNPIPVFVLAIGGVCIAMGLALYGYNVSYNRPHRIALHPSLISLLVHRSLNNPLSLVSISSYLTYFQLHECGE
eukprot:GHVN01077172.1.p1 GENE.GHVN01077172.1~~GHVN01077172.1.p1  ORF type:complete len:520 (+),score=94.77 GHVN01077172.1:170-1729(+)